ncbi:MAG: polyphosphate polymerase domain-containing protein [Cyclobacteriaceae bacterium]|nr:polyphosphate polymerase domain-containing protein [Cyclobacteriaceae bacterium]
MKVRFERKYLVPTKFLNDLRNRIEAFVEPDKYALQSALNGLPQYTVRSIYFDTPTFTSFYEKVEGLKNRKKLRIRGYNQYYKGCKVFLEIKRKRENTIGKNRALVSYDILEELIQNGSVGHYLDHDISNQKELEDASRFFFNMKRYAQKPANLVVYEREAYHGKFDPGVRITFDKHVRSLLHPQISDLYKNDGYTYLWNDFFVMEVKYFTPYMPVWARSVIQEFGLRHEAVSKYASGLSTPGFSMV